MQRIVLLFLLGALSSCLHAQEETIEYIEQGIVVDGDTIICYNLRTAEVDYLAAYEKDKKFYKQYERLKKRVIKMYPYAQEASKLMLVYETALDDIPNERERKKYIKEAEKNLKSEFEGQIRNMSVKDGIVLIKLIDRETGSTSYELIHEMRGGFSAFMWQGVARLFGSNLKDDYDPEMEDAMIEDIVRRIENGELSVASI